jgi:CheY-like chemotaxis protein
MDVYLGGTRAGIETARWLREVCHVPIVFVTAHSEDGTLERIRQVVPEAPVLSKPVYRDTLANAVSKAIH